MGMMGIEGYVLSGRGLDGSPAWLPAGSAGVLRLPSTRAMTKSYPSIPIIPITRSLPGRTGETCK